MEIYKEILVHALARENMSVTFPQLQIDPVQIVESACYRALQKIKAAIEDDSLTDKDCFLKIEEIISSLEEIGVCGSSRHDFG